MKLRRQPFAFARLGLGTAQFGGDYGITNRRGKVAPAEARRVLDLARAAGIRILDTAPAYGESETALGSMADVARDFRIVTKTLPVYAHEIGAEEESAVRMTLSRSRQRLRRDRLDGVLIHHGTALLRRGGRRILEAVQDAQARGEIDRLGVSVYDPPELEAVLRLFTPDIVQLPLNLLDQRFALSGLLAQLGSLGVEVHVRTVFLQGALLVSPDILPLSLARVRPAIDMVGRFLSTHHLSPISACIGYVLSRPTVGCAIVGVTGADELSAIVEAISALPETMPDFSSLAVADPDVISPARWRLQSDPHSL